MKSIGYAAEQYALTYLQKQGLKLVEQNFHTRMGEIDLIMCDSGCWVFIEVRYRKSSQYGCSATTITAHKQRRIIRTTSYYLTRHRLYDKVDCRFDVIALAPSTDPKQEYQLDWIKNAFVINNY